MGSHDTSTGDWGVWSKYVLKTVDHTVHMIQDLAKDVGTIEKGLDAKCQERYEKAVKEVADQRKEADSKQDEEVKELKAKVSSLQKRIEEQNVQIKALQIKSGIWGTIGGLLPVVAAVIWGLAKGII